MPVSLVTPSTSVAVSSPKRSRTSSSDALVSSTVSCSSAAHSVSVSSRRPAQILATPTGCTMKSSPDCRRWSAWCSQANRKASSTRGRSMATAASATCSSTIAKRSPSSLRSVSVRSAREIGECASGCSTRSTGTRSLGGAGGARIGQRPRGLRAVPVGASRPLVSALVATPQGYPSTRRLPMDNVSGSFSPSGGNPRHPWTCALGWLVTSRSGRVTRGARGDRSARRWGPAGPGCVIFGVELSISSLPVRLMGDHPRRRKR